MRRSFPWALVLVIGGGIVLAALVGQFVLRHSSLVVPAVFALGVVLSIAGAIGMRRELGWLVSRRRIEIAAFSLGVLALIATLGYFSARFTWRIDLSESGIHSLAPETERMLSALDEPVHVTFFHDHLMRHTRELYELMARHSSRLTVEFADPTLNPAKARMMGVQFAGTAVMRSGERSLKANGSSEQAIANDLLRVTRGSTQTVCFLDGHNEADPFSTESHDHAESSAGVDHSHGLGEDYVLHDRHGIAKARHALEAFNYEVRTLSLAQRDSEQLDCSVLVIAGPKAKLLAREVEAIRGYLRRGGNALMMLEPFVETGLEPVMVEYGIVVEDTIVIDGASHYWTDASAPAVTRYNNHQITRELPLTFFPGVRSLAPTEVRIPGTAVSPVVNSSPASFAESDRERAEFDRDTDRKGPLTIMAVANRRPALRDEVSSADLGPDAARARMRLRELVGDAPAQVSGASRVVVVGDADFATNSFYHILGNGRLFLNAINYLAAQEDLIGVTPRTRDRPQLSVTNRQLKGTFVASMLLVPSVLAMVGVLVWWRQK